MRSAIPEAKVHKTPTTRQSAFVSVPDDRSVKREIRLTLFEKAIDRLLTECENRDFVIFEMRSIPDAFVQYMFHDETLLGEVGSRGWIPEGLPLEKERVTALGCLGFEGGGLKANFVRDHLPQEARRLACLTELLFGAAYQPPGDYDVTVLTKSLIETQAAGRHARVADA